MKSVIWKITDKKQNGLNIQTAIHIINRLRLTFNFLKQERCFPIL